MTVLGQFLRRLGLVLALLTCIVIGAFLASRPLVRLRTKPVLNLEPPLESGTRVDFYKPDADTAYLDGTGTTTAPAAFPVKANQRSGIYHVPGDLAYERTVASRHYRTAVGAETDGFRHARR